MISRAVQKIDSLTLLMYIVIYLDQIFLFEWRWIYEIHI